MKKLTNSNNSIETNNLYSLQTTIQNLIYALKNNAEKNKNNFENLNINEIAKLIVSINKINSEIQENSNHAEPQNELIYKIYSNPKTLDKLMELIKLID